MKRYATLPRTHASAWLAAIVATLAGCSVPRTMFALCLQTDLDEAPTGRLHHVRVVAHPTRPGGRVYADFVIAIGAGASLHSLLAPTYVTTFYPSDNDSNERFTIEVDALDVLDQPIIPRVVANTFFVPREARQLCLVLARRCSAVSCPALTSCGPTRCDDVDRAPEAFTPPADAGRVSGRD